MTLANWTNAQVISQLDSGSHLTGMSWTYAFPTAATINPSLIETPLFQQLNGQQQHAATLAIGLWDDLIRPGIAHAAGDAHATINVSNITSSDAYSFAYYPSVYDPEGSTAWINSSYAELTAPQAGDYSFLTFMHELGHTLGLDHMGNYNGSANWALDASSLQDSHLYSVMSYFLVSESHQADWSTGGVTYYAQTPMLNDILAIQAIYGADLSTRNTDTTYGFHASGISQLDSEIYDFGVNQHPIMTLYDAGGIDTLDLSGFAQAAVIDLTAGHYSSAAGLTKNIAIAYNTTIENAVGGAGNDAIFGNTANNVLDGGAGIDTMAGGLGNDTYVIDSGADVVTEQLNAGIDTVMAGLNTTIGANVENLILTGTASINGTGNALSNSLTGNSGENVLTGGLGADTMAGGLGNDTYVIDTALDRVVEAAGEGVDTIVSGFTTTLGANIENLAVTGGLKVIATGNALDNVISGNAAGDRLLGADGNDRIYAGNGADIMYGGTGNDWLRGGGGNDRMWGGTGSDTFHFDSQAGALTRDIIVDFAATGTVHDIIEVSTTLARTYDDLVAHHVFHQVGLNAVLTLASNETVILLNVNIHNLDATDFAFV
jgi:serralysin